MLPFCYATANRGTRTDPARAAKARTACASSLGLRMLHPTHEPRGVDYKQPEVSNTKSTKGTNVGTRGAKGKEGKEGTKETDTEGTKAEAPSWRMGDVRPVTVPPRLKVVADEYQKFKASCANH